MNYIPEVTLSLSLSIHFPFADCIGQGCLFVRFSLCWREMGWFLGANRRVLQRSGTPWHCKICSIQRLSTCNFVEFRDSTFQILYFLLFLSISISYPTKPIDMVTSCFFFFLFLTAKIRPKCLQNEKGRLREDSYLVKWISTHVEKSWIIISGMYTHMEKG